MQGAIEAAGTVATLVSAFLSKVRFVHGGPSLCSQSLVPVRVPSGHALSNPPALPACLLISQWPAARVCRRASPAPASRLPPFVQLGACHAALQPVACVRVRVFAPRLHHPHSTPFSHAPHTPPLQAPSIPVVRRHARSDGGQFHFAPAVQVVHGNYVTAKRRGVVNGIDFGGCWGLVP